MSGQDRLRRENMGKLKQEQEKTLKENVGRTITVKRASEFSMERINQLAEARR
jgi:hypothetical protein